MAPNNEHHYNTHEYAGDQATQTHRTMQHMPDEDRTSRTELQEHYNESQAAELTPEVRMGEDRVIGDTPNWDAYTSDQLYKFATENNSPSTADGLGRAFNTGGNNLATAANGLFEAVTMLDGAWSGVAADSARSALGPLARAAGHAGQTAQLMGVRMSEQSVAASEVMKLPPPEEFNKQQAANAMLTGGVEAMNKDLKAQQDAADKVKREQITYLNAYTQSMTAVDNATPSFVPPPKNISGGGGGGTKITGGEVYAPTASGTDLNPGTSTGAPSGGWTGAQPSEGVVGDGDQQGDDLTPIGVGPSGGTGASGYNPGTPPLSTTSTGPGLGGVPHTGGPSAGAGGFGPGFGSFGGGGSGGSGGAGGAGGSGSGQGPGAGRGGGPGGPAPGRGMVPGGMGGRPGGAGMGPGGAGGRRGEGDEDDEHERPSYLVEGDPEGTFGSDQLTAPAVIGDDDN